MRVRGRFLLVAILTIAAAACGGGGGGGGGAGGGGSSTSALPPSSNVMSVTINSGPYGNLVNEPMATIRICVPGTSTCQSVSGILVDTGSYGLRIFSDALSSSLRASLAPEQDAGNSIGECVLFTSFVIWGPVVTADVTMGGEPAVQIPMQVIGDSNFNSIPSDCANRAGMTFTSSSQAGINGVLGIGLFPSDRGGAIYYSCSSSGCTSFAIRTEPPSLDVPNPVVELPGDNNGIVVEMPAVGSNGAPTLTGQVVFGIGTRSNNGLGSAIIYPTDNSGFFTTNFQGSSLNMSFIDTGSNGLFFGNPTNPPFPLCSGNSGFYCPGTTQSASAQIVAQNGQSTTINFSIANASGLFGTGNTAFDNLGGTFGDGTFDWGMPFFLLEPKVFIAIAGSPTSAGAGPYFAF